jgi:hypothetical protein
MSRAARSLAVAFSIAVAGCGGEGSLGPPDSFLLLAATGDTAGAGLPVLRRLEHSAAEAGPAARLLADGFAAEMLRTVYLVKQLVRDGQPGGKPAPAEGRALAAQGLPLVLGLEREPYGKGLAVARWLRAPVEHAAVPFIALPADLEKDRAAVQTVAGRLATYALHLALTGGTFGDPRPVLPPALGYGYRMAMEVVAREWRTGKGPEGNVPYDAGTTAQRTLFADIRENRFVLGADRQSLRPVAELLADPGVAATVLYRLAQTKAVAGRIAPADFYRPFEAGRLPPGVSPAAVLGTFRNFQAKLLGAWADAVQRGRPPRDIAELLEVYAAAFPAEKAEALRVFVVTTFGATVEPGGVSTRPQDATKALAAIDAAVAEVVAGKRSLRAAAPAAR